MTDNGSQRAGASLIAFNPKLFQEGGWVKPVSCPHTHPSLLRLGGWGPKFGASRAKQSLQVTPSTTVTLYR